MITLGISAYFHDSSAAIIIDGKVVAAAQEERFTRIKHDNSFPINACKYCLQECNITIDKIDNIAFFEKPILKFERILEMSIKFAPKGFKFFVNAMPIWLKEKLNMRKLIAKELNNFFKTEIQCSIHFIEHHIAHSALAYYTSPFSSSAILTIDAVGEWATTSMMYGENNKLKQIKEQHYPDSLGLLYSSVTYFLGFQVNSDEYKVMGLAPYGKKESSQTKQFIDIIYNSIVSKNADGSITLNNKFFKYSYQLEMIDCKKWEKLFNVKRRNPSEKITQSHCNLALAFQTILEEIVLSLALSIKEETKCENLCLGGGTALNCAMNGFLRNKKIFKNIFVPYSPGDGGSSIGAGLALYYLKNESRIVNTSPYLGPQYSDVEIQNILDIRNITYKYFDSTTDLCNEVVKYLTNGKIIGWFQGRMEFGPRALGNRSILADPRVPDMKYNVNSKIKFREEFRPFAPAVLFEDKERYFNMDFESPYMMFTSNVNEDLCYDIPESMPLEEVVNAYTSSIPAITHIDKTARVQTVTKDNNLRFYELLQTFKKNCNCPLLLNTSFNVMGEPIVCSPEDALNTFYNCGIDILVLNNYIICK